MSFLINKTYLQEGSLVETAVDDLVENILCNRIDHALTCLIGLVIAPILGGHDVGKEQDDLELIEVIIENDEVIDNLNTSDDIQ